MVYYTGNSAVLRQFHTALCLFCYSTLLVVGFKSVLAAGILRNLREKCRLVPLNSGRTEKRWHLTTPPRN